MPLPAYTDYLKAFPGRGFSLAGEQIPSVEQVDTALDKGGLVIISNPHNPTGTLLDPKDLGELARRLRHLIRARIYHSPPPEKYLLEDSSDKEELVITMPRTEHSHELHTWVFDKYRL